MKMNKKVLSQVLLVMVAVILLVPAVALANDTGASLPWDDAFKTLQETLTGKTAQVISVIVIAATGLMLAFGEAGSASRKALQIVFGISLAFGATSFIATVFKGLCF